jgi:D-sedoheptulose 7-phosphate isomerase
LCEALDDASIHVDLNRFPDFPENLAASGGRARIAADFNRLHSDHVALFERSRALLPAAAALAEAAISVLKSGGKLLLAGNGGSAADSQHIATELTVRFETKRRALAAIALTTDTSAITAAGNDLGFDQIFARQVAALGRAGDMFIGISTSGTSPNVIEALRFARMNGLVTACLTGRGGGGIAAERLADHCLTVPSDVTARIQEVHIFLGHLICAAVDTAFAE